jgi:hypothetical protein
MAPGLAPDRGLSLSETLAECCGVVRNVCCDMSAPRGTAFKPSAAPLPPPKLAIACKSCAFEAG